MLTKTDQTADNFLRGNAITGTARSFATLAAAILNRLGIIVVAALDDVFGYVGGNAIGGAVTQATSASTGVTLSKATGQITTVALTTAAAAEEVFTVTNTKVTAKDIVVVSTTYAGAGTPVVSVKGVAAGSFVIVITNLHASAALDAAVVVNFAIIRGQTT